jgi:hypothetical protein
MTIVEDWLFSQWRKLSGLWLKRWGREGEVSVILIIISFLG